MMGEPTMPAAAGAETADEKEAREIAELEEFARRLDKTMAELKLELNDFWGGCKNALTKEEVEIAELEAFAAGLDDKMKEISKELKEYWNE